MTLQYKEGHEEYYDTYFDAYEEFQVQRSSGKIIFH